ncbi:bifunctional diaminohydroxyphosphoribosylaminopyrimidine deaminase/5-amino-6-(5-phosphoribosylamino)uracil reductase RibD [Adhaeretor mobilis]|uniref:Riboflavin biosynthesis protein RibD n=1 Tax=Adhaeretor mobilis TaxID=1930276 RepID=A0A517MRT3_9BACT|nr:bifunctional diaminohydroxyphosphoribosylaminopyrimidine deaminase/5-amino-6-(5-phosphoribosylamino)uracil reductase RibD [Adhaeretor mobilis]QDS97584.1 Riboflavin biosynthesis protein RibD [Adhaeretor mobilis]
MPADSDQAGSSDRQHMARALELAQQGLGHVEPNPLVGCVVVQGDKVVGQGWHAQFGGPHAERAALKDAGDAARGAIAYVTLEPCCHTGKTPPCTEALIDAGMKRVVIGAADPNPQVSGGGVSALRDAGIEVDEGVLSEQAEELIAPFAKLQTTGQPWVIAKWAMTLDGKLATRTGSSQWISNEQSRAVVHELRGRMDAIVVGRQTALVDDPLLTARPVGARTPTRVVLDSQASLPLESQLVHTVDQAPIVVVCSSKAPAERRTALEANGVDVWAVAGEEHATRLNNMLQEMGRRQWTNILVEGGAQLLGSLFDAQAIDEVHAFIAPKLAGGAAAPSPLAGTGLNHMPTEGLRNVQIQILENNIYISGRC